MNPLKKANLEVDFWSWHRGLTKHGDPAHRPYLLEESFIAGYEAAKRAVFADLAEELKERAAKR